MQDSADGPFEVTNSLVFKVTSLTLMKHEMKTYKQKIWLNLHQRENYSSQLENGQVRWGG